MRLAVLLLMVLFTISGCSEGGPEKIVAADSAAKADPESRLDEKGTRYLLASLAAYYKLKDALVETDAAGADIAAKQLANNIDSLWEPIIFGGPKLQTVAQKLFVQMGGIKDNVKEMTGMMDESCEKKRIYFGGISDNLYEIITLCELKNVTIYRQYCAGAFNDKGAYWLSKDKEIRNPYFGSKMLEYGEIAEVIQ